MSQTNTRFLPFIWKQPLHRRYLLFAIAISIALFSALKYFYPYPDFISDSYSYIYAADAHLDVSIWPIGYSKFLLIVHSINHSDLLLVALQYILLQTSALYLFFTLLFHFPPKPRATLLLYLFLFINPMFIYLANLVNSDALFAALTLFWLSELIWIIRRPSPLHLLANAVLLFLCFAVRNNAYYYPIVAAAAFLLSKTRPSFKTSGILLPFIFIIPFILYTREASFKMTGVKQFSFFTGWQIANNAMYAYPYIHIDTTRFTSPDMQSLDRLTRKYFADHRENLNSLLYDNIGNYFVVHASSPLKVFYANKYDLSSDYKATQSWGQVSPLYEDYGKAILQQNPLAYFRGFVLLNLRNYLYPPLSSFEYVNPGGAYVRSVAQDWFDWPTSEITSVSKYAERQIVLPYPYIFLFLNIYIFGALFLLQFQRTPLRLSEGMILSLVFLALNFGFTILTTMNILRYQVVPMTICLITATGLTDLIRRSTPSAQPKIIPSI